MANIPIPARGRARVLMEATGEYGGKGSSRMRRRRGKTAVKKKIGHSAWIPFTLADPNTGDLTKKLIALSPTTPMSTPITIAPYYEGGNALFGTSDAPWKQGFVKSEASYIVKFDGTIRVVLPKVWDADMDSAWAQRPMFVFWCWRKRQVDASGTVQLADKWDVFANQDANDNQESWQAMANRGSGAMLRWGTFIIQPDFRPSTGRFTKGDAGSANTGVWASTYEAEFHQQLVERRIPFPRIPPGGFRMGQGDNLVLQVGVQKISTHNIQDEVVPSLGTPSSPTTGEGLFVLPWFRYLLATS